jgi:hypothetical protein
VELLAPFSVEVTSPSLQQERLEQMQRTVAERKAADRAGHFQRATELLKQWDALKAAAPSITPGQMLEQLNPTDRGAMLETLIMASAQQGAQPDLWAVAGQSLVRIDLKGSSPQPRLIALPTTAGPLRSVTVMNGRVLVGARNGVFVVDPARPEEPETYLDPELQSEYGFTRVTFGPDNTIFACHRDGGVVGWSVGQYDRPAHVRRAAELGGAPKNLLLLRGKQDLLFTVEQRLMRWTSGGPLHLLSASGPILSLFGVGDQLIVVGEDGFCSLVDSGTLQLQSTFRPVSRVSSASVLPWLTSFRLLLAQPDGAITGVGVDDQLMTQYAAAHLGFRDVTASAGKVAAMSADRQRIVLWNAWDGRKPAGEIYLTSLTRHRIADISFAS